jgi:hypothetical protein
MAESQGTAACSTAASQRRTKETADVERRRKDAFAPIHALGLILGSLCLRAPVTLAADNTSGQLAARIVAVEGASTTVHVEGMHGQMVTAQVPSRSIADVHLSNKVQGTVRATVASVDRKTHRVKVHTHEGQKLVVAISPAFLKERRISA